MAFLFEVTGKVVFPTAETLLISPFKEIWERDKSKEKYQAIKEFTYIEFLTSMKKSNPYKQYSEDLKPIKVKEAIFKEEEWRPDELVNEGLKQIKEFQEGASTTYSYYIAAKKVAEKMKEFFIDVDINERNERGAPVWKPKDITSALNDTEKVLSNLKTLEKKVEEELFEETKTRSNKQISPFAEPGSLKLM
jgi:hypothetical protein|tara:strand:- start:442 stop:1017 length:576 start_codon:yes stop_codon:yes gene_type:complete